MQHARYGVADRLDQVQFADPGYDVKPTPSAPRRGLNVVHIVARRRAIPGQQFLNENISGARGRTDGTGVTPDGYTAVLENTLPMPRRARASIDGEK